MTGPVDAISSKRKRVDVEEEDDDQEYRPKEKPAAAKKARKPKTVTTTNAFSALGPKCSMDKKQFGDRIKGCLALEKYEIQPMSFNLTMNSAFFRSFFGGKASITPPDYDHTTPVVVAQLNNAQAGQVFGVSKIKNGNRYTQFQLRRMVVVFYPPLEKASCWISV